VNAKKKAVGVSPDIAAVVAARDWWSCVHCGKNIAGSERGTDWSIHHRIPRGMGGTKDPRINAPANLLVLCGSGTTGCQGLAERCREMARERGLILSRSQNPDEVPVEVCIGRTSDPLFVETRLFLLDNEGSRLEVNRAEA
jgi:hypothetical protein